MKVEGSQENSDISKGITSNSTVSIPNASANSSYEDLRRMEAYPLRTSLTSNCAKRSKGELHVVKELKIVSHFKRPDIFSNLKKNNFTNEERPRYARFREKHIVCDICGRSFTMKQNMAHHFYTYHHPRLAMYNRPQKEYITNYQCSICDMIFTERDKAERHEKFHEPPHKKVIHKCNKCERIFQTPSSLKEHIQVVHEHLRPFSCDKCDQTFGRSGGLKRHVLMIHENKVFKCTYEGCSHPGYKCSKALAAHIRSVHTHERPFDCLMCGKKFTRKNDLRVHEVTHRDEANFKCEDCGTAFKRSAYLKKHQATCVKKQKEKKKSNRRTHNK